MTTINSVNRTQSDKPSTWTKIKGMTLGTAVGVGIYSATPLVAANSLLKRVGKINKNVDTVELRKGVEEALNKNDLGRFESEEAYKTLNVDVKSYDAPKKIRIVDVSNHEVKSFKDLYKSFMKNSSKYMRKNSKEAKTELSKIQTNFIFEYLKKDVVSGKQSYFLPSFNEVWVNMEKMGTSVFHEIGHFICRKQTKFGANVAKMIPLKKLGVFVIPTLAILTPQKSESKKSENTVDKARFFIKDNAGKLSALTLMPILIDELNASVKGNKLAKSVLTPEMYKKVVKTNRLGALTYIIKCMSLAAGVFAANNIKDYITKPKTV
ncbi:hypothetical protein HDR58_01285 [bacterium]|nr:hypothetical protein [bacterium]